jgi:16S rRNA (cytidine1402-2'-O)-methyltransferase
MSIQDKGVLYIVATPIGHLEDITYRAVETLKKVDYIVAEDTRHSKPLLTKLGIQKKLLTLHEHNERLQAGKVCDQIANGMNVALISDAGTPLISDPGYHLVRQAQEQGIRVIPIPGASALITALSASGLPTDRFVFEGFLSAKTIARCKQIEKLQSESRTMVFYEAPHRILETLSDMVTIFGQAREAVLARELTKTFEIIRRDSLAELLSWVTADSDQSRGEIVLLVAGSLKNNNEEVSENALDMLKVLLEELPLNQAAQLVAKITRIPKRVLYDLGLKIKSS